MRQRIVAIGSLHDRQVMAIADQPYPAAAELADAALNESRP